MEESYFCLKDQIKSPSNMDDGNGGTEEGEMEDGTNNDLTINTTIDVIKKDLSKEEEFRSINHAEPIHIFLKLKPLSTQEALKEQSVVSLLKS